MPKESKAVTKLVKTNFEFKQLHKEHEELKTKIDKIARIKFPTEDDEKLRRELQKKKLVGKDRMEQIMRQNEDSL